LNIVNIAVRSQAFDQAWLEGLMDKIITLLPENTHKLLEPQLYYRVLAVRCNATISNQYTIEAGVPPGSGLGPSLFIIYTADIPTNERLITSTVTSSNM